MARKKTLINFLLELVGELFIPYILIIWLISLGNKDLALKLSVWGGIFLGIIFIIIFSLKQKKFQKTDQWFLKKDSLDHLKSMKPWEFEEYIAQLYSKLGHKTERVGGGYDGGVDVIAEKNGIKHYIQCKKYITSTVGVKEIREFYGVLVDHTAQGKGIFITTNVFTSEADYFAQDKPIELIDGQKLVRLIRQVK